jgi:hypothetical protein
VPDLDTGFLKLNTDGGKLLELEAACRCACGKNDCACPAATTPEQTYTMPLREAFAGPGLPSPDRAASTPTGAAAPSSAPLMTPRPQAPTGPAGPSAAPAKPRVGNAVTVEEKGRTYDGKVAGIGPDGRYRLTFGANRPILNRDYSPEELRVVSES